LNTKSHTYSEAFRSYRQGEKWHLVELCYKGLDNNCYASIAYAVIKNLFPLVIDLIESKKQYHSPKEVYDGYGLELCHQVFEQVLEKSGIIVNAETKTNPAGYIYTCFRSGIISLHRMRFPISDYIWKKINDVLLIDQRFKEVGRIQDRVYQLSEWEKERILYQEDEEDLYRRTPNKQIKVIRRELPNDQIRYEINKEEITEAISDLFEASESALTVWQIHAFIISISSKQDIEFESTTIDCDEEKEGTASEYVDPESIGVEYNEAQSALKDGFTKQPDEIEETLKSAAKKFIYQLSDENAKVLFWWLTDKLSDAFVEDILPPEIKQFIKTSGNPKGRNAIDFKWIGEKTDLSKNTVRSRIDGPNNGIRFRLQNLYINESLGENDFIQILLLIHKKLGEKFGFIDMGRTL